MKPPLPVIDGVGPSCRWLPAGPWKTVLDFLTERYPGVEVRTWTARMQKGQVVDETGLRLTARSPYRAGACIFYYRELESERRIPFVESVLYEDEHILVADKPHFLPVIPSGRFLQETLLVRLRRRGEPEQLVPVHRLDRETAGVVLFSLNPATRGLYASLFRERKVEKVYEALARTLPGLGLPLTRRSRIVTGEPFFRMKEIEGEPNSETHVAALKRMNGVTLYRLSPVTGRKHQIRLHLSALGIPIINDRLYPELSFVEPDDFSEPLKLLAKSISFRDPLTGRERHFESGGKL
ncbi:MAG: tRNA pseudouridine32 synthase / rRNA pseudouridine746 synthase [Acidobacteriota bacterium]|nr:tRNA pseudouridine32 synthase / rRNA pseudouridine746 synthase [Acidobacteriota bacterium]